MKKGSEIIDFLMDNRIPGISRKDLMQRLGQLRIANLYPIARRVGDRVAEPVNEEHCANLILSLLCADAATDTVEAVKRFGDMRLVSNQVSNSQGMTVINQLPEDVGTLREVLTGMIHNWRRDISPWASHLDLRGLMAKLDGNPGVLLEFLQNEPDEDGDITSEWMLFGDDGVREYLGREKILSMHGDIIGWMVQFLGRVGAIEAA